MNDTAAHDSSDRIPQAVLRPRRRISSVWLIPIAALGLAGWLALQAWIERGITVSIQMPDGHGLKPGDSVRFRGTTVGKVDRIELGDDLKSVVITARLTSQSDALARSGTRFWVVHPRFQLTRVEGLETIIGPRFLAVLPVEGEPAARARKQRQFVALSEAPVVEHLDPGDLEVVLSAPQRGSLAPGGSIMYRQTRIGTILSVGLAGDGSAVEARGHIQRPYVQLIRPNTRFWDAGGLKASLGLTGVSIEIDSAEALLTGGVALATPPPDDAGGDVVRTGHRFTLAPKPEDQWLEWQPSVVIGSSMLPPGILPPSPMRASIGWTQGRWITREKSRRGWVLQTDLGLLGPANLLLADETADPGSIVLEVQGQTLNLQSKAKWQGRGLALIDAAISKPQRTLANLVEAREPEDCIIIGDPSANPIPLSASRLRAVQSESHWLVDDAVPMDESWHGACVVSRRTGAILGFVLVDEGIARVAVMPARFDSQE